MWPASETLELSSSVFVILRDMIHDRTGIFYDAAKRELLAQKLSPYVVERGFSSFLDFFYLLKYGPTPDDEWVRILDVLSVQETYFWREMQQVHALVGEILPSHIGEKPTKPVRIWCAACATGEEPLSIAIALAEAGWTTKAEFQIMGTDGSAAALSHARLGEYRERSFRALPTDLREKYFDDLGSKWRIRKQLLPDVSWTRVNLADASEISMHAGAAFVFCRNVFIYFSDDAIKKTLAEFAKGMARPGFLFVGASESLLRVTDEYDLQPAGNAFVYALR